MKRLLALLGIGVRRHETMAERMRQRYANFPASDPRSPSFIRWARKNHTDEGILTLAHSALMEMVHPKSGAPELTPAEAAFLENSVRHHLTHTPSC